LFARLDRATLDAVAALCVSRRYATDETIFAKGDDGDKLFAIRRGQVRIVTGNDDGKRLTLNVLGAGDVFGEIAMLDGLARTADAIAAEPSELYIVHRRDFLELLRNNGEVAIGVIAMLCDRLRWTSDRMEEAVLMPLDARLARRISAMAEEFGNEVLISQAELAVFVGATRESINRILQEWRRDGIVAMRRGALRVLDAGRLAGRAARTKQMPGGP
jgi:CRP-like cAMP-binding protein